MDLVKSFFDSLAKDWDKSKVNNLNRTKLIKSLPIKENDLVLDLGCGTGAISKILYDITKRQIIGIDISTEMINIAKTKYDESIVKYININYYDFKYSEQFDSIVVFNSYPHFIEIEKFINQSIDNLKDGGYLSIVHDLSKDKINECHKSLNLNIKRELLDPLNEYNIFKSKFDLYKAYEDDHKYILILKKK